MPKDEEEKAPSPEPSKNGPKEDEAIAQVIPEHILKKLPPDTKKEISQFFGAAVTMGMAPPKHPVHTIAEKLTSEHLDKFIDVTDRERAREADDRQSRRKHGLWVQEYQLY